MPERFSGLKRYYYKKSVDFEEGEVTLYNFHPQLRLILALNGVFFSNRNSIFRFALPSFNIFISTLGMIIMVFSALHGKEIKDYSYATECGCYAVLAFLCPVVILGMGMNKPKIYKLIEEMNSDFEWVCSLGPRYRKPFLARQLILWQIFLGWSIFVIFFASFVIVLPVIQLTFITLFVAQDEFTKRPMQYDMYIPYFDVYASPIYEFSLVFHGCNIIGFATTFSFYIYVQFHVSIHQYFMMDMIILDIEVIFEGLDESVATLSRYDSRRVEVQNILNARIERIVTKHLGVFRGIAYLASFYGPILVCQVMLSSIALCAITYQVVEKLEQGVLDVVFILLFICAVIQLFLPCYLGSILMGKGFDLGDTFWTCGWHETPLGPMIRQDILIFIWRTQVPLCVKFIGLPNLELSLFSAIMSRAYSYFNMLRQYSN